MGEQIEFTWVMNKFSSLQEERRRYSRPFAVAGCNWHLFVQKGDRNDGDLALYLELANPESLPLGWKREVKFSLTLVNKGWGKSNHVLGAQCFFDAKNNAWGYNGFISLTKLHAKGEGFLVNNKLTILAKAHVLPAAIVLPEEPVKSIEPQSSKEGIQASVSKSQVAQETDNVASQENLDDDDASEEGTDDDDDDDASEESLDDDDASQEDSDDDDDDDASQEDSEDDDDDASDEESLDDDDASQEDPDDDNASTPVYDDGGSDISPLNQSNALEEASHTIGNHGIRCNSVAAETEVSNGQNDDAPELKDVDDEASSLVSNDSESSLEQVKSLEDASQTEIINVLRKAIINVLLRKEIQPVKETMDINGFEVVSSKVESVRRIFESHPDIAVEFRAKNQHLRNACMNFLLSVIETMCQSLEELSNEDLVEADIALTYLRDAGFKVDWLEKKLDQLKENKEEEQAGLARLQEIEEILGKWKQQCSELEALAEEEKAALSATRTSMSFDDLV